MSDWHRTVGNIRPLLDSLQQLISVVFTPHTACVWNQCALEICFCKLCILEGCQETLTLWKNPLSAFPLTGSSSQIMQPRLGDLSMTHRLERGTPILSY